jgi:hypothetical protein
MLSPSLSTGTHRWRTFFKTSRLAGVVNWSVTKTSTRWNFDVPLPTLALALVVIDRVGGRVGWRRAGDEIFRCGHEKQLGGHCIEDDCSDLVHHLNGRAANV